MMEYTDTVNKENGAKPIMRPQVESGLELFARVNANTKPRLCGFENTLFPDGLRNIDVIEIGGERSTGKTLLLSQILAKCILPDHYRTIRIQGLDASVILINTDHHFQTLKLVELMNGVIDAANQASATRVTKGLNLDKTSVIQESLRNLNIIDCYNSEQFSLTLRTLDDVFINNTKIVVLAIDSITAYYWEDREANMIKYNNYVKELLQLIKSHTTLFNILTIYTTCSENTCNKKKQILHNVDYKLQLSKTDNSNRFLCTLQTEGNMKKLHYSISSSGIKWKLD
ncbi:DNA repair protein XRCC2 [Ceratina calcarata]|uniref:DNA repair protein XRCC2 n=1 Tax=Ceratina calcarata TaxID=156304 RepID=A0AAJ7J3X6_9HYME|nr:DNA repair protein XRCC2 [Ceratina calcarata]